MNNELFQNINNYYSKGIHAYTLEKYISRDYWTEKLNAIFQDFRIINLTDFTYSKCFTLLIDLSSVISEQGSLEFRSYLETNTMYGIRIEISVVGPFACAWFIKHRIRNNKEEYVQNEAPFIKEHSHLGQLVNLFFTENGLKRLENEELALKTPGIILELSQDQATVYNCLFIDS